MNTHLLIVDPQHDFCDPHGALSVKGADDDMLRLAKYIDGNVSNISQIHVTLDNHRTIDIAHPLFWVGVTGKNPSPFTIISLEDVKNRKWVACKKEWQETAENYVIELNKRGRFPLVIWPEHCIIGTLGACVYTPLMNTLLKWEQNVNVINYIPKGSNIFTEHYGAFEAEVPDPLDPSTSIDMDTIDTFKDADEILIAGEALSHCVSETTKQLARFISLTKFVLLENCTSNVTSFEKMGGDFVNEMVGKGMKTRKI